MLVIGPTGHIYDILRGYFQTYGYWTVACALLLENMGLPVPGETTLLFGGFLASTEHQLRLPFIIVFGTLAATAGDNAGYAVGHFGGRRLVENYLHLLHISRARVEQGERFFAQHGALTVYLARFIAGLRIVAGPLAGTLRMPWDRIPAVQFPRRGELGDNYRLRRVLFRRPSRLSRADDVARQPGDRRPRPAGGSPVVVAPPAQPGANKYRDQMNRDC